MVDKPAILKHLKQQVAIRLFPVLFSFTVETEEA